MLGVRVLGFGEFLRGSLSRRPLLRELRERPMGSTVLMALGSGRELPPGIAGGKPVVEARGARPAQTPGYIGGGSQVTLRSQPSPGPTAVAGNSEGSRGSTLRTRHPAGNETTPIN